MPTRRQVRELAYHLWEEAGKPELLPPQHFWLEAERQLTPEIVLALSEELRKHNIIRMPGDAFWDDFYYDGDRIDPSGHPVFAVCGVLHENCVYSVNASSVHRHFDLNREEQLNQLIDFIVSNRNPKTMTNLQPSEAVTREIMTLLALDEVATEEVTLVGNFRRWSLPVMKQIMKPSFELKAK